MGSRAVSAASLATGRFCEVKQKFPPATDFSSPATTTAPRLNGSMAAVVKLDLQESSIVVEQDDGERQMLDLRHLADRHVRPG